MQEHPKKDKKKQFKEVIKVLKKQTKQNKSQINKPKKLNRFLSQMDMETHKKITDMKQTNQEIDNFIKDNN